MTTLNNTESMKFELLLKSYQLDSKIENQLLVDFRKRKFARDLKYIKSLDQIEQKNISRKRKNESIINIREQYSSDIINSIKSLTRFYHEEISRSEDPVVCSICIEKFSLNTHISTYNCCHTFHTACITKWLEENFSCPLCREIIQE